MYKSMRVCQVGLRVLELINLLICLGDSLLPSASLFESFAYELVRRHAVFEKLYRVSKRAAPRLVDAMALARRARPPLRRHSRASPPQPRFAATAALRCTLSFQIFGAVKGPCSGLSGAVLGLSLRGALLDARRHPWRATWRVYMTWCVRVCVLCYVPFADR